jgi:hypothetical protein
MIRGAQAAEGGLQGAGACSGPRGSPGQHARLWVSRCRLLKRRSSIVGGRSIFLNFQHPPENSMIRGAQAAEGGLQGAGACSGPRGSPGQHARLWASRCRLLKRRSSIVGGRSIFSNFQHPPENSMIRGAQAAEGGLQGAGACSGPRGSPGQHARLWVSRCRLLKRRSSIVGGRSIFSNFQHPPENSMIRGAQAAEGGLQGAGACSGPRGSPGQHARLWVSRCRLLKRRSSIVGGRSIFLNFQHPPENSMIRGAQAAERGLQGAGACSGPRGSPGQHARLWVSRCRLLKRRSSIVGGRSIFSNFQHPPENSMIRGAQAAEGGLQGAGACSGPRGSPGQHACLWVSRCRLLKRRSSIVGGRSIFLNFQHPPESSMIRVAQAAERGLQGAGACSGPRGSPGQHARLWVSRCRLLKRRSSIVGGRSIFSNFQQPPENSMIRGAQAAEGGLQGAGACSGPRGSPGQHARLWVSRCWLFKRRSSIVGGRSIFSNFHQPPESSMIRGAQAAEGGLQGAGACSGPRGSPGQHARLWVSRCRLLKRRSSIVGGRSIFLNFQHPPENSYDPRCAGSGGRTPGCRRLLGASGQPGAACAPLGKQMPALEAPVQHRRGEVDFLEFSTPPGQLV